MEVRPRLFVIERDQQLATTIQRSFEQDGYEVVWVNDHKEALAKFYWAQPSLVCFGLMDADHDWLLLQRMRELSDVPIVIFINQDQTTNIKRALDFGADACLMKPFASQILQQRVNMLQRRLTSNFKSNKGTNSLMLPLQVLRPNQIRQIDAALVELGETGELRLVKQRGHLKFIHKVKKHTDSLA